MMDVKVEVGDPAELAVVTPEQMGNAIVANMVAEEAPARTSAPTLDDVMSAEELEQVTAEGLAANPPLTEDQEQEAQIKAQQIEAHMNYLKQQRFFQFMSQRPVPATLRKVDWGLLRMELIVAEKAEFDHQPEIAALTHDQWCHGIITGNVSVYHLPGTNETKVSLRQPYLGYSTQLASEQLIEQFQKNPGNRKQRRLQ